MPVYGDLDFSTILGLDDGPDARVQGAGDVRRLLLDEDLFGPGRVT